MQVRNLHALYGLYLKAKYFVSDFSKGLINVSGNVLVGTQVTVGVLQVLKLCITDDVIWASDKIFET